MAVEGADERAVFTNPDEFGITALYGSTEIAAVFESDYFAADVGASVPVEGGRFRLHVASADLPDGAAHGDELTISSCPDDPSREADYVVREMQPDGAGFTVLVIERQ